MRRIIQLAVSASVFAVSAALVTPALAQSTGSQAFDAPIIVTGTSNKSVGGIVDPDTSKAKASLDQEWIKHQIGGQSINDVVNYLPGVSYTNNDPYGGTSGNFYIRGFDNTRISETLDGVTLNDDGNYALYGGELLDTEIIDKVTVNLGTTDVDSPTASATGSTVNFTSHMPSDTMAAKLSAGYGTDNYYRVFGMVETGVFDSIGTKAWLSASQSENNSPYDNYGKIRRHQFNGKIYQPVGTNGDFISLAGFYVVLRNNFSGSDILSNRPLAADTQTGFESFPTGYNNSYYNYSPCTLAAGGAGAQTTPNKCGTAFEYRPNPANLLNIRAAMKFTLADNLVFTADPSYQFTKANGGGTVSASEGFDKIGTDTTATGFIGGSYYLGRDLNGDGDTADKVTLYAPSQTKTHRVALTSSLRYDIAPTQTVRLAYAFARSDITQTGELGFVNADGSPADVYAINAPVLDGNGNAVEKRNTESIAMLNQIAGEYRGQFFDKALTITAGVRAPFVHRSLDQLCFTNNGSGATSSVTCVTGASETAYAAANPNAVAPQTRIYNYHAVLPNVGGTYKIQGVGEIFANYSKGYQAPYTTALYPTFYFAQGSDGLEPRAEKSDNFDLGYRFNGHGLTAMVDLWYTNYQNKLGTSYDAVQQITTYTNLGPVKRYGVDANVGYKITPHANAYLFGSWLHSKIDQNSDTGTCAAASAVAIATGSIACVGTEAYLQTAGKSESAMPHFMIGGRLQGDVGPLTVGVQAKHTAVRYVDDENMPLVSSGNALVSNGTVVWGAKLPSYTTVDLDARFSLKNVVNDRSFVQLNVTNLFNAFYAGSVSPSTTALQSGGYDAQVSPPRAVIGSITIAY